jgi:hypothetical protein
MILLEMTVIVIQLNEAFLKSYNTKILQKDNTTSNQLVTPVSFWPPIRHSSCHQLHRLSSLDYCRGIVPCKVNLLPSAFDQK